MKDKMLKKICTFLCVCMIACSVSVTAFAAEPNDVTESTSTVNLVEQSSNEVVPYANDVATGSIPAWSSATYTVHLNSYIGFSKTFRVTTQSPSSKGGYIDVILKKGDKLVSDGNWWMGVNQSTDWKVTLPSSGEYTVEIVNHTPDVVYITAQWL